MHQHLRPSRAMERQDNLFDSMILCKESMTVDCTMMTSLSSLNWTQWGTKSKSRYRGAWVLLVDNGFLNWSSTIALFKKTTSLKEHWWFEWIESMRKDIECTFGILKGRWRILKSDTRVHGHKATDMVWKICRALHNWLLDIDGLDKQWMEGVHSPWEGELGHFDTDGLELIPEHIRNRLELYNLLPCA